MSTLRSEPADARAGGRAYLHRGGELPLTGETIDERFRRVVAEHGAREAVVSLHQGLRLTYAELDRRVEAAARGLLAWGIERGERVGIWATDNAEWIVLQLATARVGAVLVNVNPAWQAAEVGYALERVGISALFAVPGFKQTDYVAALLELCPELAAGPPERAAGGRYPALRHVVVYEPEGAPRGGVRAMGLLAWDDLLAAGEALDEGAVARRAALLAPDDVVNIQFTSGTTGLSKPVALTHHNILNNAVGIARELRLTEADRLCVSVPFYHCFGMVVANLACLSRGAAIVVPSTHFEPGATLAAIEAERCTAVHGVPTMFVAELEHEDFPRRDLSSLRTGIMAGAPCPPELVRRVIEDMGCADLRIGFGQTEASPVSHLTRAGDSFERRIGSVGTNLPHLEVRIEEPGTGRTLRIDEQGEICVRGYSVMRGYYGDEEATRRAVDEAGWLHTGDLGVLDADGYLRVTGRLKDMIIRGGENIFPAEIEAFLFRHEKIAQVAVFGVPDERMGEEVAAWVQLHEGCSATPEELREFMRGRIAHFKIPRYVSLVDDFPKTVTGKIQKFRMRDRTAELLARGGAGIDDARRERAAAANGV